MAEPTTATSQERTLGQLVAQATDDMSAILRAEMALAKAEIAAIKSANAAQDAYINTVLLGTATIPAGQTVIGFGQFDHSIIVDNEDVYVAIQLPGRAPTPLSYASVNFAPMALASDADATCTGNSATPTAPAGKVCIYLSQSGGVDQMSGFDSVNQGFTDQFFLVKGVANGPLGSDLYFRFSWAYTVPPVPTS